MKNWQRVWREEGAKTWAPNRILSEMADKTLPGNI